VKRIRWTPHAKREATRREIHPGEAETAVSNPDSTAAVDLFRQVFMKRYFDSVLETEMLLRVVVEETETELVIVSLYKTSRFEKYEQRRK
jgi:hypothetical protein